MIRLQWVHLGGGSGGGTTGGDGGGYISITTSGTLLINGSIQANGASGTDTITNGAGGGAGGAIKIVANIVSGTPGNFRAKGGIGGAPMIAGADGGGGGGGCIYIQYSTSNAITAGAVDVSGGTSRDNAGSDGVFTAEQSVSNTAPTASTITVSQVNATEHSFTTTVADSDSDVTSLVVEHSTDNATWTSSTIKRVTTSEGSVTTSTGQISSIDTDSDGSVDLTVVWDSYSDLYNIEDTSVYLRVWPNDGTLDGTVAVASAFEIDTKAPTAPGLLASSTVAITSLTLAFPSTTSTDNNFSEYKVYYSSSTPVSESDSVFTSSTDSNLGNSNFNAESVSGNITGLEANTKYYFKLYSYDTWGASTSSASELSAFTAASVPSSLTATPNGQTSITVSWVGDGTEYYTSNTTASTNSGWTTNTSHTFTGLYCGRTYSFTVKSKNGDSVETSTAGVSANTDNCSSAIITPIQVVDTAADSVIDVSGGSVDSTVNEAEKKESAANAIIIKISPNVQLEPGQIKSRQSVPVETTKSDGTGDVSDLINKTVNEVDYSAADLVNFSEEQRGEVLKSLPKTEAEVFSSVFSPNTGITFNVNRADHSLVLNYVQNVKANFTLYSKPYEFDILEKEEKTLDTNADGIADVHIVANDVDGEKIKADTTLTQLDALPVTINDNFSKTKSGEVVIRVKPYEQITQIALSNSEDFSGTSFTDYEQFNDWVLEPGEGTKTVFVKFRSDKGVTAIVSDTIEVVSDTYTEGCLLKENLPYKTAGNNSVYYITDDCTKRPFRNSDIFFSYYDSWNSIVVAAQEQLASVKDDELGFMAWGPKYNPVSGSLVKIKSEPDTYFISGTKKYRFLSQTVFETLGFSWDSVVDVALSLLEEFTYDGEVTDTENYPDYTLIKYEDSPKVYQLHPNPEDGEMQIKRWIPNKQVFENLGFNDSMIVVVPDAKEYADGEQM